MMAAAESARAFEALERQADLIVAIFQGAGYERVAPAIIQPADIFLDCIGERVRSRTYVFTDMDGKELCLRPDLTIPVSRIYIERHPFADMPARYCYNGPAFRHHPPMRQPLGSREFRQAGLELFGVSDKEKAEVEVLSLVIEAVRAAGLNDFALRFGDLGLFRVLLDALPIPERWRVRLLHDFWHPQAFHDLLDQLSGASRDSDRAEDRLARHLPLSDPAAAEAQVGAYLEEQGLPLLGERTLSEITGRLVDRAADLSEPPLAADLRRLIEAYLAISGPPRAALARIEDLAQTAGVKLRGAIDAYRRRLDLMGKIGIGNEGAIFAADFGRQFEYYSGFVFQLESSPEKPAGQIAGGGRYDRLLRRIGATEDVPAVGSAIHTERLLAAVGGEEPWD